MEPLEVIVVGSGPSGAMAAQTLLERGATVTMLDVGRTDNRYAPLIPDGDFPTIRSTDPDQHRYLLGDAYEGIPTHQVGSGAQLTPPRRFVTESVDRYLPIVSETFSPTESLAYGGLGAAWGLGCCVFSSAELHLVGLDVGRMREAYQVVADRIGISGAHDDATPYTHDGLDGIQPAHALDENGASLQRAYQRSRDRLRRQGFRIGRPALALLTKDREERRALAYRDMDFYLDRDRSAYRPWITLDALRRDPRFRYVPDRLVLRFEERDGVVEVECLDTRDGGGREVHRGRRLVLATGALGTARIVLRSQSSGDSSLPVLSNPYSYVPCIQPRLMGTRMAAPRTAFAQLALFHDPDGTASDVAMGSIYSYRSLMLFRILPYAPIDMADARILMRFLLPAITIMGIHHPEAAGAGKRLSLEPDAASPTGDRLRVSYQLSDAETGRIEDRERRMTRALRTLGALAIKRIRPPLGASIHYAGTLPFADDDRPFSLHADGRLGGTRSVWVADGSGFRFLPAKGLTLSLMANAHLVATAAHERG